MQRQSSPVVGGRARGWFADDIGHWCKDSGLSFNTDPTATCTDYQCSFLPNNKAGQCYKQV